MNGNNFQGSEQHEDRVYSSVLNKVQDKKEIIENVIKAKKRSNYQIVTKDIATVLLRDVGPHDQFSTITNDAENVVVEIHRKGLLNSSQNLYYFDSEGELTELVHEGGKFVRFRTLRAN